MTKQERYINDNGVEMCRDLCINDETGEIVGQCEYPYVSPEEQERANAELLAQRAEAEQQKLLEAQQEAMNKAAITQILLNQAQLTAALKAKGVIE